MAVCHEKPARASIPAHRLPRLSRQLTDISSVLAFRKQEAAARQSLDASPDGSRQDRASSAERAELARSGEAAFGGWEKESGPSAGEASPVRLRAIADIRWFVAVSRRGMDRSV